MGKYRNRKCHVCGKPYQYCPSCSSDINKPLWMIMFDTEECKTIFYTLTEYFYGRKAKEEVRQDLAGIELGDFDEYMKPIDKQLHEIYDDVPTEPTAEEPSPAAEEPEVSEDLAATPAEPKHSMKFAKKRRK